VVLPLPGGCTYGTKVHIGVDKDSGLIHSVKTTLANVHDITRAAQLLHGEEEVIYSNAGYQGIEKRAEIAGKSLIFPGCHEAWEAAGFAPYSRWQVAGFSRDGKGAHQGQS
jgi:hypothetical protein